MSTTEICALARTSEEAQAYDAAVTDAFGCMKLLAVKLRAADAAAKAYGEQWPVAAAAARFADPPQLDAELLSAIATIARHLPRAER